MKTKNVFDRFRLWWTITSFRFCVSTRRARWAQKFLDRIPLPVQALDKDAFRRREKQLWEKYLDLDGKLRLFTWKGFFNSLLKIAVTGVVVFVLISVGGNLAGKIDELNVQMQNVSIADFQMSKEPGLSLNHGQYLAPDMKSSPLFSRGELYFPLIFKVGETVNVFYIAGKGFKGEFQSLEDCRTAKKFVTRTGHSFYYVYAPGSEVNGNWMDEPALNGLKATIEPEPGTGINILPREKLSRELRIEPSPESEMLRTIPKKKKVEFIRFAPVSSISTELVWARVKYTMETGQCFKGWIAVFSFKNMYVTAGKGSDTVEVTDPPGLTFRNESGDSPVKIGKLTKIPYGARVKFLKFAPIEALLSGKTIRIQVRYTDTGNIDAQPSSAYTVWVNAGSIRDKFIGLTGTPGESLKPTGEMKTVKTGE